MVVGRVFVAMLVTLAVMAHGSGPLGATEACPSGPVALTFDDGPGVHTAAVLDALAGRAVPATLFPVGRRVDQRPDLVRRAAADGHVIGNHTYDHENLTGLSDAHIRATVLGTTQAVERAGVRPAPLVRPPYGATDARVHAVLRDAGYTQALWTIDPQDWRGHPADAIVSHVLARLAPGAVVVMHDGNPGAAHTAAALPRIVDEARARGFCFGVLNDGGQVAQVPPSRLPQQVAPPQQVEVIAGRDRFETGVAVSRSVWHEPVPAVVLAEGDAWPDAVSGSVLAATLGGPLLLTRGDRLDPGVTDELRRLAPEVAYLLGPLDQAVEDAVWALHIEVRRLRGPDRYATSELIAYEAAARGADPSTVLVATGVQFADALAATSLAAERHPLLLSHPDGDGERLQATMTHLGAVRTMVIGGRAAVPDAAVEGLPDVERIAGPTRTATAAAVADRAVQLTYSRQPIVVSGWRYPDALSASTLAARHRRPVLLTAADSLSPDIHAWLLRQGSQHVTVVGGSAAVGPAALCQLRTGYDTPDAC